MPVPASVTSTPTPTAGSDGYTAHPESIALAKSGSKISFFIAMQSFEVGSYPE